MNSESDSFANHHIAGLCSDLCSAGRIIASDIGQPIELATIRLNAA